MGVHVKSEIGTLKRVMLHRPGRELEQLVPGNWNGCYLMDSLFENGKTGSMTSLRSF